MECPFCAEQIRSEAIVCKSCGRDLRIVRPILREIQALTAELDRLQQTSDTLKARLAFRRRPFATMARHGAIYCFPPILLLVAAHFVIVVTLDMTPLMLRMASLFIPLPFGIVARAYGKLDFRQLFLVGLLIGAVSVGAMLTSIGHIDKVPIIPSSLADLQESAEYGLSIALAFLTGGILAHLLLVSLPSAMNDSDRPSVVAMQIAKSMGGHTTSSGLLRRARRIQALFRAIGPIAGALATATGSVYTGLRLFLRF